MQEMDVIHCAWSQPRSCLLSETTHPSEGDSLSTVPGPRLTAVFSLKPQIRLKVMLYPLEPQLPGGQ